MRNSKNEQSLHIFEKHPLPAAGVLGLLTLPFHLMLPVDWSYQLAAFILAMISGVYIGFAAMDRRLSRLILESLVAVGFALFAMVALQVNPIWLALGYIFHGVWDAGHHLRILDVKMARWYIPACAAYDIAVGLGLYIIWTLL